MTYQELITKLSDPTNLTKDIYAECYEFMRPTLKKLRLRQLSKRKQDERVLGVFNGIFRKLYAMETAYPEEYWKRLLKLGTRSEFEEFQNLQNCRRMFCSEWRRIFFSDAKTKASKKSDGTKDTAGNN